MDGIAIVIGSTICSILLMVPTDVCQQTAPAQVIGSAMMLALIGVLLPMTWKVARKL